MLAELEAGMSVEEIMKRMDSGMPKLWVIYKALHLRREHPEWFGESSAYAPMPVEGSKQEHLIAFLRGDSVAVHCSALESSGSAADLVPRRSSFPQGRWTNLLTGEDIDGGRLRVQNLFAAISGCASGAGWWSSDASI